jgi:hypothetical protein
MTIERAWYKREKDGTKKTEEYKEITEDRASRELANAHGDDAVDKLKKAGKLETQYAYYRVVS